MSKMDTADANLETLRIAQSTLDAYQNDVPFSWYNAQAQLTQKLQNQFQELLHKHGRLVDDYERLEGLAFMDHLTRIGNRRYFDLNLSRMMADARKNNRALALYILDVDDFKKVNDVYGHNVGDIVLKGIARSLEHTIRSHVDILARYGGEEFAVIAPLDNESSARAYGERIRTAPHNKFFDDAPIVPTLSVGVSLLDRHTALPHTEDTFCQAADNALYLVKRTGKNRVEVYTR